MVKIEKYKIYNLKFFGYTRMLDIVDFSLIFKNFTLFY